MVPEWFVLPPHSRVPLFESWPLSFERAACFMLQVLVVKQPTSVMNLSRKGEYHILYLCIGHMFWGETCHKTKRFINVSHKKMWKRNVNNSVILCYKDKSTEINSLLYKLSEKTKTGPSFCSSLVSLLCPRLSSTYFKNSLQRWQQESRPVWTIDLSRLEFLLCDTSLDVLVLQTLL